MRLARDSKLQSAREEEYKDEGVCVRPVGQEDNVVLIVGFTVRHRKSERHTVFVHVFQLPHVELRE